MLLRYWRLKTWLTNRAPKQFHVDVLPTYSFHMGIVYNSRYSFKSRAINVVLLPYLHRIGFIREMSKLTTISCGPTCGPTQFTTIQFTDCSYYTRYRLLI